LPEEFVRAWTAYLDTLERPYEVLLAGRDCAALAERYANVRALSAATSPGFGAALRTGIPAARYPLLAYASAGEYLPSDLTQFLERIDRVDLVAGYRMVGSGAVAAPPSERRARWLIRLVFGLRMRDPSCRFLLARRSIFARIPIQSDGPFAHVEVLAKANFIGCWMAEAPVAWQAPSGPTVPPVDARQARAEFWRLFKHPDFGPAILPEPTAVSLSEPPAVAGS
jgi:hypothetical protein